MIARVRIAPMEQWCKEVREIFDRMLTDELEPASGTEITIDTQSMRASPFCSGRAWTVAAVPPEIAILHPVTGEKLDPRKHPGTVCEHVLELD